MTIQSTKTVYEVNIKNYLQESYIKLLQNEKRTHDNDTLKDVTEQRAELIKLKAELEKLNNNVQDNEQKFFAQK